MLFLDKMFKENMRMKFFIITIILISFNCYQKKEVINLDQKEEVKAVIQPEVLIEKNMMPKEEIFNEATAQESTIDQEINRDDLIAFAKTFIGVPYVYATQDPNVGFDCSGYINYIFKNYDIIVPRSSSGFKNFGKQIDVEAVKLGDVLVFTGYKDSTSIGHLGIVCEANGLHSKFIHASSGKVMQVTISDLNSTHYANRFHHAVDVIND